MKAIIVDDSIFMRRYIRYCMENAGIEVVAEAGDGLEGFACYEREKPDFATLDVTMNLCDGICCLKKIRAFDPDAIVFMVSAMGQEWMMAEAIEAGAKGFVVKPFTEEKLQGVLESIRQHKAND